VTSRESSRESGRCIPRHLRRCCILCETAAAAEAPPLRRGLLSAALPLRRALPSAAPPLRRGSPPRLVPSGTAAFNSLDTLESSIGGHPSRLSPSSREHRPASKGISIFFLGCVDSSLWIHADLLIGVFLCNACLDGSKLGAW